MLNLKIGFIALTIFTLILLSIIGFVAINRSCTNPSLIKKRKSLLVVGLLLWQLYTYCIAQSGLLDNFEFPPRFFIFLILPQFVFIGIFLYRNRNGNWIKSIPEHWLIFFQSFRILVESLFVASLIYGVFNKEVTIEGYNFDMVFAFTAPIIGILSYKKFISKNVIIVWNYLGLAVLASVIFVFLTSIFNPQLFGSETMLLPTISAKYPFILIAGFLMPSAVFVHVLSIVQLSKKQ